MNLLDSQVRSSATAIVAEMRIYCGIAVIRQAWSDLLDDDAVCPFHQGDEDRWAAELGSPLIQVCFRDPTGPGASSSSKDGNVFVDHFLERFAERRPPYRENRAYHRFAKQGSGLSKEKDLDVVPSLREDEPVRERKCSPGGIIGSPSAFHHDLELFRWRLGLRRCYTEKWQAG